MTQQEINNYFSGAGYTEVSPYVFTDGDGFTYSINEEDTTASIPHCMSSTLNVFLANDTDLSNWITVSKNNCTNI